MSSTIHAMQAEFQTKELELQRLADELKQVRSDLSRAEALSHCAAGDETSAGRAAAWWAGQEFDLRQKVRDIEASRDAALVREAALSQRCKALEEAAGVVEACMSEARSERSNLSEIAAAAEAKRAAY